VEIDVSRKVFVASKTWLAGVFGLINPFRPELNLITD